MSSSTSKDSTTTTTTTPLLFDRQKTVGYFAYCLRQLPGAYVKLDTNRLTLVHFAVQALDLLGVWDDEALLSHLQLHRKDIIEWIYALQVTTDSLPDETFANHVGFKGGTFLGGSFPATTSASSSDDNDDAAASSQPPPWQYNHGHIAMTYTALATLRALGDDLSRVDKCGIVQCLGNLQLPDGSYRCIAVGSEHDMRFLYCACCISHMLNDWSGVDIDKAVSYIRQCHSWDGAFALLPGQEGHGGSTFCAVASLVLMQKVKDVLTPEWKRLLLHWCVGRQVGGMQGRPNKAEDTCYSYWIGGTLRLLSLPSLTEDESESSAATTISAFSLLNHEQLRHFVLSCQSPMGGFSKVIGAYPDVLHAFYSLAYLSMSKHENSSHADPAIVALNDLNCTLGFGNAHAACMEPLFP